MLRQDSELSCCQLELCSRIPFRNEGRQKGTKWCDYLVNMASHLWPLNWCSWEAPFNMYCMNIIFWNHRRPLTFVAAVSFFSFFFLSLSTCIANCNIMIIHYAGRDNFFGRTYWALQTKNSTLNWSLKMFTPAGIAEPVVTWLQSCGGLTLMNTEVDWRKTNITEFSAILGYPSAFFFLLATFLIKKKLFFYFLHWITEPYSK